MAKFRLKPHEVTEFKGMIQDIAMHDSAKDMKNYVQHADVSTYRHAMSVALLSYCIVKRFRIKANEESLVKGAFLHDYFLYDWHEKSDDHKLHGFTHARKAAENARRFFAINQQEYRAINSHMWPLTLTKLPVSRIGWILCVADKYCAMKETIFHRR